MIRIPVTVPFRATAFGVGQVSRKFIQSRVESRSTSTPRGVDSYVKAAAENT